MMAGAAEGPSGLPEWTRSAWYLALTTFRPDGSRVTTPVWFAADHGRLLIWTGASTGKVGRINANPAVTIAKCSVRGRLRSVPVAGMAKVLPATQAQDVHAALSAKYRLIKRLYEIYVARRLCHRPRAASAYLEIRVVDAGRWPGAC
jgi:PPOX class probable F420-dependent enzyme